MERVQAASRRLAERTAAAIAVLWDRASSGAVSEVAFPALAAATVARANRTAVELADVGLVAEYLRQLREPVAPLGLAPDAAHVDVHRLRDELIAVLDDRPKVADTAENLRLSRRARLAAVGRAEPLVTFALSMRTAMLTRGVAGWTRVIGPGACPICVGLADGVVRAPGTFMARHPGCSCVQQPVLT